MNTVNHLPKKGAWWSLTLSGRLLVVDGASWVVAKGEAGTDECNADGPGLTVHDENPPRVQVTGGPALELPGYLSAWRDVQSRLLSWPLVVKDGKLRRTGGSFQGMHYFLNSRKADWIALPYVTSYVEIPWEIEAVRLPVAPAR